MTIIFCDASFDPHYTIHETSDFVRGKIAICHGDETIVEKIDIKKVPGLKQYINILELVAIARGVELATLKGWADSEKSIRVYTDSQVAMFWARNKKIKQNVLTPAHENALAYLRKSCVDFGGIVTFDHVFRENNPAGRALADELKRESPHVV